MAKKKDKKKLRKTIGVTLCVLMAGAAVFMLVSMFKLGIFPVKTAALIIAGMAVLAAVFGFIQFTRFNIAGNVLTVILAALFLTAAIMFNNIYSRIDKAEEKQKFTFSVLVLMENDVSDLARTYSYFYGYNKATDKELTDMAIAEITKDVRLRPVFKEYNGLNTVIKALFDGDVKAVVFNEANRPLMEKIYPDFNQNTRILKSYEIETDIKTYNKAPKDSFSIYFSYNSKEDGFNLFEEGTNDERNLAVSVNKTDKKAVVVELPNDCMINYKTDGTGGNDSLAYLTVGDIGNIPATFKEFLGLDINYFVQCHTSKDNTDKGISGLMFGDKVQCFTNLPPKEAAWMLKEEIFNAKDWNVEYYSITGSTNKITGQVYGIENMTVTVPDEEQIKNILTMLQ